MSTQEQIIYPLIAMDDEELVSNLILADRAVNNKDFVKYRKEVMYRLRCARPLVGWTPPVRMENNDETD